uniref:Methyltransferase domain-containing protein n=1 Tax=Erysiphe necator associated polymycovirus 5 TaxID=2742559 RepID=A0A8E3YX73_9VIRU|nr:hypothetical protein [Erysiphe necator associated polymycovirus 5]
MPARRTFARKAARFSIPADIPESREASPAHTQTEVSHAVTLARSSRTGASSTDASKSSLGKRVLLPLALYEYNFPTRTAKQLSTSELFKDPRSVRFLNSPAGQQLRKLNGEYNRMWMQYLLRNSPLAGKTILVLGCGASRSLAKILNRGVLTAVLVDSNALALEEMRHKLDSAGVTARVDVQYVKSDAWDYISLNDEPRFDVVIATKCVGQILASGEGRTATELMSRVEEVLNPDGEFFSDQHDMMAEEKMIGKRLSTLPEGPMKELATVGGRYTTEVGYTWFGDRNSMPLIGAFRPHTTVNGNQQWTFVHFRRPHVDGPRLNGVLSTRRPRVVSALPAFPWHDFNVIADNMIPVNHKGNKRILNPVDENSFDPQHARPKFDGMPAVMIAEGTTAAVMSARQSIAVPLPVSIEPALIMTCEVVEPLEGGTVIVANGVISIGDIDADPNDAVAYDSVLPVLDRLHTCGIIPVPQNSLATLSNDTVELPSNGGRKLHLPVDGISPRINGSYGSFIKPGKGHTIDLRVSDKHRIVDAARMCLRPDPVVLDPVTDLDAVWEFSPSEDLLTWRPVRPRPDKQRSDKPGACIHSTLAALMAYRMGLNSTVQQAASILA